MNASLDQSLVLVAITAYILGTVALLTYFLSRERVARLIGIPLAFVGCIAQFVELVVRYQTTHIWPLTNLYGSLSLFAAMSVAIFLGFALRYDLWFLGGFVQALAAGFLAYGLTWNEGYLPPVPALQSYWIKIHVPLVVSAYAAFMVAAVGSFVYLLKYYTERSFEDGTGAPLRPALATGGQAPTEPAAVTRMQRIDAPTTTLLREPQATAAAAAAGNPLAQWIMTLPSLGRLDVITWRIVAIGLVLLSVGIATGAAWAKEAWGAYWQWDPKETAALVSWIIYLAYMHLHTRNAWRGLRCAWINIGGFLSILFCYLGVNIFISGLHSYKM